MSIEGFISAILVGAVIGLLGRLVVPGKQNIGCLLTIGVGILAALVGGVIANAVGVGGDGFDWATFGIQVLVAAFGVAILAGARGGSRKRD